MLKDIRNRPLRDLRISVTDRCNLRCRYCMPLPEYDWVDKKEVLTFEEIVRATKILVRLGVEKVRLTGGEPLLRRDLEKLVAQLSALKGLKDISLTTNGLLLDRQAGALRRAGLRRINVSLDTLNPEKFKQITQRSELSRVLAGLSAAQKAGFHPIKINTVVMRGTNDDEILDLMHFCRENRFSVRFIEYMDVGNANHWSAEKMVSKKEILEKIQSQFNLRNSGRNESSDPAVIYKFSDGASDVGVIASVTEPFCRNCDRARLTADGKFVTCLFSQEGHDLKALLRNGSGDDAIKNFISAIWSQRKDRFSEERREALNSARGYRPEEHKKIEMIRLGG